MAVTRQNGANQEFTINADGFSLAAGDTKRTLTLTGGNSTLNQDLRTTDSPTFANITDTGLTASKPVFTDGSKQLTSSGTMPVDQGGTGDTTYTDGQLLIGNTVGNTLAKATLTAGTGISITNGNGSIEIDCTLPGLTWSEVTADNSPGVGEGLICNGDPGLLTVTLPGTFAVGDMISVVGKGAGKWKIVPAAGDTIIFGNVSSKAGGYIAASHQRDCVTLICVVADSTWTVKDWVGNIDVETS